MTALVIPNALQVVVSGACLGTPWVNTFGVVGPSPFLLDQSVADEIGFAFRNSYILGQASLTSGWSLSEVLVRDLRTATSPTWAAAITTFSGSNAGQAMPPQLAIVASHSTGFRGASYRGRTYFNGFTESLNEGDGSITVGGRELVEDCVASIKTELATVTGGPFELAVLSRKLLEANVITNTTVNAEWDRQDRRKRQ